MNFKRKIGALFLGLSCAVGIISFNLTENKFSAANAYGDVGTDIYFDYTTSIDWWFNDNAVTKIEWWTSSELKPMEDVEFVAYYHLGIGDGSSIGEYGRLTKNGGMGKWTIPQDSSKTSPIPTRPSSCSPLPRCAWR